MHNIIKYKWVKYAFLLFSILLEKKFILLLLFSYQITYPLYYSVYIKINSVNVNVNDFNLNKFQFNTKSNSIFVLK